MIFSSSSETYISFAFISFGLVKGTQPGWYVIGRLVSWRPKCGGVARLNVDRVLAEAAKTRLLPKPHR